MILYMIQLKQREAMFRLSSVCVGCELCFNLTINFVHSLKWLLDYCVWKIEYWFNGPWITANSFKKDSRIIRLIEDELHRYIYLMDYHSWLLLTKALCLVYVWFVLLLVFSCLLNNSDTDSVKCPFFLKNDFHESDKRTI